MYKYHEGLWISAMYKDMVNRKMIIKDYCSAKEFKNIARKHLELVSEDEIKSLFWDTHSITRLRRFLKSKWLLKW